MNDQQISEIEKSFSELQKMRQSFKFPEHKLEPQDYAVMRDYLTEIGKSVDTAKMAVFVDHRKIIGPIVAKIKTMFMKKFHPLLQHYFIPQIKFNHHIWNICSLMILFEERLINIEHQLEELKKSIPSKENVKH